MSPAASRSSVTGTLSLPRKDSQFWVNASGAWSGVRMPFIREPRNVVEPGVAPPGGMQLSQLADDQLRLVHRAACRVQVAASS